MKKLYQVSVRSEIQVPQGISKEDFSRLLSGTESTNLVTEGIVLVSSENEDDAIVDGFCKYLESSTNNIGDYSGAVCRGETRNRYYIRGTIHEEGKEPIETKVMIDLFPKDLGI